MKRLISGITAVLAFAMLFGGCANQNENTAGEQMDVTIADSAEPTKETADSTIATTEEATGLQGKYVLEDCKGRRGVYILHGDGSFDKYPTGGFCYEIDKYGNYDSMYLKESVRETLPTVNSDTQLVVFWEGDYTVSLKSVIMKSTAMSTESEEGIEGFVRIIPMGDLYAYYRDHTRVDLDAMYINGVERANYEEIETVSVTVNPYKGMSSKQETYSLAGFKMGETITVASADGTTLVEHTYQVDSMYYDCDKSHRNYFDEGYSFSGNPMPTTDGYATLDLSGIPSGEYVMVVHGGGKYVASLVYIEND